LKKSDNSGAAQSHKRQPAWSATGVERGVRKSEIDGATVARQRRLLEA
jgi:hypothetical protein